MKIQTVHKVLNSLRKRRVSLPFCNLRNVRSWGLQLNLFLRNARTNGHNCDVNGPEEGRHCQRH